MKRTSGIIIVLTALILAAAILAGCGGANKDAETETEEAAKYTLSEDLKKYGEVSAEAEEAILAFIEKYSDIENDFASRKEAGSRAKLAIEVNDEYLEKLDGYINEIYETVSAKYKTETGDAKNVCMLLMLDTASPNGLLYSVCGEYQYFGVTGDDQVEKMENEAIALIEKMIDAYTTAGEENK